MMKFIAVLFFAAIQGIGTAIVCWLLFQTQISFYQHMKNLNVESFSQQLGNERTASDKPRFESQAVAHAEAEKEVAIAKKIQTASAFKITVFGGLLSAVVGIVGFVVSIFVLLLTRAVTKPSYDYDSTPADRFFKGAFAEFVVATIFTIILSALFAIPVIGWTLQRM